MSRSDLRRQEQLQHCEDDPDEGGSGDAGGSYGETTDQDQGLGYGPGDPLVYYGTCMEDNWTGPDRPTEQDAQADCDAHDASEHGGEKHAFTVPGDRT